MLNSTLHSLEHYCVSVRPIALLYMLCSSNNAIGHHCSRFCNMKFNMVLAM